MGLTLAGQSLERWSPPILLAEVSGNHGGSEARAHALLAAAAAAGADVVKLQAFTPAELTVDSAHPAYRLTSGPWAGRRLWDLYQATATPLDWLPELFADARERGLGICVSVFGAESFAACEALECPAYKIASAESDDHDLIRMVARSRKPVLASWDGTAQRAPADAVFVRRLYCAPGYPAPVALPALGLLALAQWHTVGFSDHSPSVLAALQARRLGAVVFEKHLMLEGVPCEDAAFSLTPAAWADYAATVRSAVPEALPRAPEFARRLVFARACRKGERIARSDLRTARCREGLTPTLAPAFATVRRDVRAGEPVTTDTLAA